MSAPEIQPQELPQNAEPAPLIPEALMYKNRLQEYTQKASILFPSYWTANEGSPHAPQFRSRVVVDGTEYVSANTFSTRKASEQDVARVALTEIFAKTKDEITPFIRADTIFSKSILNEYAVKMNFEKPSYTTEELKQLLPVFVSEVTLNGVKFKGEMSKNKKEAEQSAARVAILAILETGSRAVLSEMVKSKAKIFAAMSNEKGTSNNQSGTVPVAAVSTTSADLNIPLNKRKEMEAPNNLAIAATLPVSGHSGSSLALSTNNQAVTPFHEFKKPKVESSSEVVAPPITFVPEVIGGTVESLPCSTSSEVVAPPITFVPEVIGGTFDSLPCSTSAKRRNRKKKKNAIVGAQGNPQLPIASTPLSQGPSGPVTQS